MGLARSRRWLAPVVPAAVLVAGMTLTIGLGPAAAHVQGQAALEAHPAHIHSGSCAKLGDVVDPLTDVGMDGATGGTPAADASPMAMGEMTGAESALAVETSVTTVDAALDDLLAKPYAINIHEGKDKIADYIACGDIGGRVMPAAGMDQGDTLVVGLRELNDSGHSGIAVLTARGDQTIVGVYLSEGLGGPAPGGATETPVASASAATEEKAAVTIVNFAYDPDPIEIPAGGTITWTNNDGLAHTATATDRDVLQSGTIKPGKSYSKTFDEPGTYTYFCEFHAQMHGTVVVQ